MFCEVRISETMLPGGAFIGLELTGNNIAVIRLVRKGMLRYRLFLLNLYQNVSSLYIKIKVT